MNELKMLGHGTFPLLPVGVPARDGNIYTKECVERMIGSVREKMENHTFFGTLDPNPFPEDIGELADQISNASHLVTAMHIEGGTLMASVQVLDTEEGEKLLKLLDANSVEFTPVAYGVRQPGGDMEITDFKAVGVKPIPVKLITAVPETLAHPLALKRTVHQLRVDEFMKHAQQDVPEKPTIPSELTRRLRARLILEESMETIKALGVHVDIEASDGSRREVTFKDMHLVSRSEPDLVAIADGCADIKVVTTGTLTACGLADQLIQREVDLNNLSKFEHLCPKCGSDEHVVDCAHVSSLEGDSYTPGMRQCTKCIHTWRSGYRREDGKWIKPENFKGPDLEKVIRAQIDVTKEGKFNIVAEVTGGPQARVGCRACGEMFWIDPSTEENLVLKTNAFGRQELFAKCPKCGQEEDPI